MSNAEKPGFLARAQSVFTRNWGLKLLSLALAIVIYYALKPESQKFSDGLRPTNHDKSFFLHQP